MNNSNALSAVVTVSAFVLPWIKLTLDRKLNIQSNKHKKYQFIKEFINDINRGDEIHPLVIQHGASILFGGYLDKHHVKHLLELRIETHILLNYSSIRTFIDYESISSRIIYKKEYRKSHKRKIKKIEYFVCYCLFVGLPALIFICLPVFSSGVSSAIAFMIGTLVSFMIAYLMLFLFFSLRNAEVVVKASSEISNLK